jgi:hypothetical protein
MKVKFSEFNSLFIYILYLISGSIFGLLNYFNFGFFYLGELMFLLFLTILFFKNSGLTIYKGIFIFSLAIIIFIGHFSIVGLHLNVNEVFRNLVKFSIVIIEAVLIYHSIKALNFKFLIFLFSFLFFSHMFSLNFSSLFLLEQSIKFIPIGLLTSFFIVFFLKLKIQYLFLSVIFLTFFYYLADSRTTLLIIIVYLFFIFHLFFTSQKYKPIKVIIISSTIFFILLLLPSIYQSFENLFLSSTASNNERILLLQAAFEQFSLSPLLGIGIGNFNNHAQNILNYNFRATNLTPHNLFIELLAETGLIGLSIFLFPILLYIVRAVKQKNIVAFFIIIVFITYFSFNTFSGISRIFYSSFIGFITIITYDK